MLVLLAKSSIYSVVFFKNRVYLRCNFAIQRCTSTQVGPVESSVAAPEHDEPLLQD